MADDPSQNHDAELAALRAIVEGTARATGDDFFRTLVRHLAAAMSVGYAFVAEFAGPDRARTLAYWKAGDFAPNFEWDVTGTPCQDVVRGSLCHYPTNVADRFPGDPALKRLGIQSYLGVPLRNPAGQHLGHLVAFDSRPMPEQPRQLAIFHIFAARAAAELERLRMEQMVADSEARYRDLYDEAPIAYIYEDVDSRFVRANKAACKLLGLKPNEVPHTQGITLVAPEMLDRAKQLIRGLHEGKEHACVELELRRKDDGRPVWVQWYSRPEPDGRHTRTMLIDVTDRVLAERQATYLREEIDSVHNFQEIVGRSPKLLSVLTYVRQVAPTDAAVLITGESGTGKELVARAIHSASPRAGKPLIKVNCAALPTGLVESELFGHERGAFSGAIARRIGRFELAHGGTIFLDEIGELPLDVQSKLLRVLQEKEFDRVGGTTTLRTDARVIAATNRDLAAASRAGTFRQDLFYRLNVFPLHLPPLRERPDDVPLLVQFLLARFRTRLGKPLDSVTPATLRRLAAYPWPGNIRELENVLERAAILATTPTIDIPPDLLPTPAPDTPGSVTTLEDAERQHILSALQRTRWVIDGPAGAGKLLDMHPNTLRSRMKKLGLSRPPVHEPS